MSRAKIRAIGPATSAAAASIIIVLRFAYGAVPAIRKPLVHEAGAWGTSVFFAIIGWGSLVHRAAFVRRRIDVGLLASGVPPRSRVLWHALQSGAGDDEASW